MNSAGRVATAAAVLAVAVCLPGVSNGLAQGERPGTRLVITDPGWGSRTLTAAEENVLDVRVANAGTRDVEGIRLSVTAPKGWAIFIEPETLDLRAGSSGAAKIRATPPASAADGRRHSIGCTAESPEVRESTVFDVNVRRSHRFWLATGTVLALVVVAGFILVYLRYGRG